MKALAAVGSIFLMAVALSAAADRRAVRTACPAEHLEEYYFPTGTFFPEIVAMDQSIRRWYSEGLFAMNEPSFSCGASPDGYRFTWLRSFRKPIIIRVESAGPDGEATLNAVEIYREGEDRPYIESRRVQRALSLDEANKLRSAFEQEGYWTYRPRRELEGFDGAEWIIEARVGNQYFVTSEWSPDDSAIRRLGLLFLSYTGWSISEKEIY